MVQTENLLYLDGKQRARVEVAKIASELLRSRSPIQSFPATSAAIIKLSEWLLGESTNTIKDAPLPEAFVENRDEPMVSHAMLLELTYDSPITHDTVEALVQSHQEDEGLLRVRGRLV